jgi:hypothetical protein
MVGQVVKISIYIRAMMQRAGLIFRGISLANSGRVYLLVRLSLVPMVFSP